MNEKMEEQLNEISISLSLPLSLSSETNFLFLVVYLLSLNMERYVNALARNLDV